MMMKPAQLTLPEILTQPQSWAESIQVIEQQQSNILEFGLFDYDLLVFIGCGSTYYLSLSAAGVMQTLSGINTRAIPSSELILSPKTIFPKDKRVALCAISRSGTTTETLHAVEKFASQDMGDVIVITNGRGSPLSKMGKINLVIPTGFDKSIAQTRSFTSMYLAAVGLACAASQQDNLLASLQKLVPAGQKIIKDYQRQAKELGENQGINRFFFLGSGIRYGLACEASLKLKEMSLSVSEPFHFLEFRHGPISMIDSKTMVFGLLSEENYSQEQAVLDEVKQLGAKTITLGEKEATFCFNSGLPETIQGPLYLPVLQLIALYRSLAFGLNPDKPRNLSAVITLDHIK
jgi:glucosamine--fructose-6-phosphate aminotransferase (isomerizing)